MKASRSLKSVPPALRNAAPARGTHAPQARQRALGNRELTRLLRIARRPKAKKAPGVKAPPPPSLKLFDKEFVLHKNATSGAFELLPAKGNARGWSFTATANGFTATRTLSNWAYAHAGGKSDPIEQRATIVVTPGQPAQAAVPATGTAPAVPAVAATPDKVALAGPIVAAFPGSTALQLPLDDKQHIAAPRKSETVFNATVERLDIDLPALPAPPAEGDMLTFGLSEEAFVFGTLKRPAGDVSGFFEAGVSTSFKRRTGLTGPPSSVPAREAAFDKLLAANKITAGEAAVFKPLSEIEAGFAEVQNYDRGVLSFGYAQWTVASDLAAVLQKMPADVLQNYLGQYGLTAAEPDVATEKFFKEFVPDFAKQKLGGFHTKAEGSFFVGGTEVLPDHLIRAATDAGVKLDKLIVDATAAQADLTKALAEMAPKTQARVAKETALKAADDAIKQARSAAKSIKASDAAARTAASQRMAALTVQRDAAKGELDKAKAAEALTAKPVALAQKKIEPLVQAAKGLPGVVIRGDPAERAAKLIAALQAGRAKATQAAGSVSLEDLRKPEWVLRFQLLGQDPDAQSTEVKSAQDKLKELLDETWSGVPNRLLLTRNRGRALLLSTYYNNPSGAKTGMVAAVKAFAAARAKDKEPAWKTFPWPAGDKSWSLYTDAQARDFIDNFAMPKMLPGTHDPARRETILKAITD